MGRKTALAMMAAGAIAFGAGLYMHEKRFSNEAIWQRQRPKIERVFRDDGEAASAKYGELRTGLGRLEGSSLPERCRFEKRFEAVLENGSPEKAEEQIRREHFRPHPECDTISQIKESATSWHGMAGAAGLLVMLAGAASLVRSFFNRDRVRV